MIKLYDLSDKELSKGIKSLSPILYDGIQIENKLLDGTSHIQIIGDPQRYVTFEILANQNQVDNINSITSQGGPLKLRVDNKYYIGYCYVSDWQRITIRHANELNRWYTSNIKIMISSEGVI